MNSFLLAPESMKEHWPGENTVSCYEILFPVHSRRMEVENIEIKEMVNPLSASVQAVNNEMRHLRDSVDKLHNDQTTLAKQVNIITCTKYL